MHDGTETRLFSKTCYELTHFASELLSTRNNNPLTHFVLWEQFHSGSNMLYSSDSHKAVSVSTIECTSISSFLWLNTQFLEIVGTYFGRLTGKVNNYIDVLMVF